MIFFKIWDCFVKQLNFWRFADYLFLKFGRMIFNWENMFYPHSPPASFGKWYCCKSSVWMQSVLSAPLTVYFFALKFDAGEFLPRLFRLYFIWEFDLILIYQFRVQSLHVFTPAFIIYSIIFTDFTCFDGFPTTFYPQSVHWLVFIRGLIRGWVKGGTFGKKEDIWGCWRLGTQNFSAQFYSPAGSFSRSSGASLIRCIPNSHGPVHTWHRKSAPPHHHQIPSLLSDKICTNHLDSDN